LWAIALVAGAVVLLVVLALLLVLYRYVKGIDTEVSALDTVGGQVAGNTVKIRDLLTTAAALSKIRTEVDIHDRYLSGQ
jgi:multisubunit Na+/H+ antiporter MnhF subunit